MNIILNINNTLKQLSSETSCFSRKIENLSEAIELKDIDQIEIEFSNLVSNFEEMKSVIGEITDLKIQPIKTVGVNSEG